ncbi:MAG: DUF2183 domain-containing protein [Bdellovibrionales bacterium]|nr:DUF2183 domain-containing protein [Bdellovibrionales bacterium]
MFIATDYLTDNCVLLRTEMLGAARGEIVFFPTLCGSTPDADSLDIPIHAWSFEHNDSKATHFLLRLAAKALGCEKSELSDPSIYWKRASLFVARQAKSAGAVVRVGERLLPLKFSSMDGHSWAKLTISRGELEKITAENSLGERTLTIQAWSGGLLARSHRVHTKLLAPAGISVISDIDDTIKLSHVHDKRELLANTFTRSFKPIPGMAALYQEWRQQGASFHYVSSTPWQLYGPLEEFMTSHNFPSGTFHLKSFGWRGLSWTNLFKSPLRTKPKTIEPILKSFPQRRFVLVGDAGEKDPEIYGELARKYSSQIAKVFIRLPESFDENPSRFSRAFRDFDSAKWMAFRSASELPSRLECAENISK